MSLWLVVLGMGAATFAIRLSLLVFVHHGALPRPARDALRFVSPAVLTAILLPAVLYVGDAEELSVAGNERLLAAAIASAVAWLTRNVWLTIGIGMAALWVAKSLEL